MSVLPVLRSRFAIALVFALALAPSLPNQASAATRSEISIVGDDDADAYRGTGGLLLASSFSGSKSTRVQVASCMGCIWRFVNYCRVGSTPDVTCTHSVVTCPTGKLRYRIKFSSDGANFRTIGSICQGARPPTTRRDIERALNSSALHKLPALNPTLTPTETLTVVPITVAAQQPREFLARTRYVGDTPVALSAQVSWRWQWGDGTATTSRREGKLTHQYRRPGTYRVVVQSTWRAKYEVKGLGTFSVPGIIGQEASQVVEVRQAHSVLLQ